MSIKKITENDVADALSTLSCLDRGIVFVCADRSTGKIVMFGNDASAVTDEFFICKASHAQRCNGFNSKQWNDISVKCYEFNELHTIKETLKGGNEKKDEKICKKAKKVR